MAHKDPAAHRAYQRAWREKNRARYQAKMRAWTEKNRERLKVYNKVRAARPDIRARKNAYNLRKYHENKAPWAARVARWKKNNPQSVKKILLKARLKKYGLTLEQHQALYDQQEGCCASCGVGEWDTKNLHIDHDHKTGKVRGLLCYSCNATLGYAKEEIQRLAACIRYLKKHGVR